MISRPVSFGLIQQYGSAISTRAAYREEDMSAAQISRFARGAHVGSALLFLVATFVGVDSASAQIFQWTPEQLTKYTAKNP